MPRFYELLQQEDMTRAEALRQTQAEFIDGNFSHLPSATATRGMAVSSADDEDDDIVNFPGYSHPYFWAPFILMGNWL